MKISLAKNILLPAVITAAALFFGCKKQDTKSYLVVEGKPGRILRIDKKTVIKVDKSLQIQLPPGNHLFELSAPGYETVYHRASLQAGKKIRFKPEMHALQSSVLIESTPSGAQVHYNNKFSASTWAFRVREPGTLVIEAERVMNVSANLQLESPQGKSAGVFRFLIPNRPRKSDPKKMKASFKVTPGIWELRGHFGTSKFTLTVNGKKIPYVSPGKAWWFDKE